MAECMIMARAAPGKLKRKSFFVDEKALQRVKRALGVSSDAEAVRKSIQWVDEMERFWQFMDRTRGTARGGFEEP